MNLRLYCGDNRKVLSIFVQLLRMIATGGVPFSPENPFPTDAAFLTRSSSISRRSRPAEGELSAAQIKTIPNGTEPQAEKTRPYPREIIRRCTRIDSGGELHFLSGRHTWRTLSAVKRIDSEKRP